MKKLRVLLICLILILTYIIGKQVYYFIRNDKNNLTLVLTSHSEDSTNSIRVLIDEKEIYYRKADFFKPVDFASSQLRFGKHTMDIYVNDKLYFTRRFCILLNKWVLIDKVEGDNNYIIKMKNTPFMIE